MKRQSRGRKTPNVENNYGMQIHQLHDGEKLKTVTDLIRDISGATFTDAVSPSAELSNQDKKSSVVHRSNSVVKSTSGASHTTGKRRGNSVNTIALKSVNEVFTS